MSDYQRIANAIRYINQNHLDPPALAEIAAHIGLSPFHFQRLFTRYAGVSPTRFLQYLTASHVKKLLRQSVPVLEESFAMGLSRPGRLNERLTSVEAVTPGEFKKGGYGIEIRYGIHPTVFGDCLLGVTSRGICCLHFVESNPIESIQRLQQFWLQATLVCDKEKTKEIVEQIFTLQLPPPNAPLPLLLHGTNFQIKVWQALLRIPEGALASYGFLAKKLGCPGGGRAIGSAIGKNPIGYIIPCHRVLRANGEFGGYRWGKERKMTIVTREALSTELTKSEGR